jgi:toxin ParE1/3/4
MMIYDRGVRKSCIPPGPRALPYRERCICYRPFAERVVILRMMHMAQDVKRRDFEDF